MRINKIIKFIIVLIVSFPKIIYVNFRCLSFREAIHLPVFVRYNTKIISLKRGKILIKSKIKPFIVRLGFGGTDVISAQKNILRIKNGKLVLRSGGSLLMAEGFCLDINGGILSIGGRVTANRNCMISCSKDIYIGDNSMMGWNVHVRDSDGHTVYKDGNPKTSQKSVYISEHVWLCSNCSILKGSQIQRNSIVSWGTIVSKPFSEDGVLIGCSPCKVLDSGINWGPFSE